MPYPNFLRFLVPYEVEDYLLVDDVASARAALSAAVEPVTIRLWPSLYGSRRFQGDVTEKGFCITLAIDHANPFRPMVVGSWTQKKGKDMANVRFVPHPVGIGALAIWYLVALLMLVFAPFSIKIGIILIMGCVWCILCFGFHSQLKNTKEMLRAVIGG